MKFKVGHFYRHKMGRTIAVLDVISTYAWGKQLVVEETDPTGQGISCVDVDAFVDGWLEITKDDWTSAMKQDHTCCLCGLRISAGTTYRHVPKYGLIHEDCYKGLKMEFSGHA